MVVTFATALGVQAEKSTSPAHGKAQKTTSSSAKPIKQGKKNVRTPNLYGKTKSQVDSILKKRGLKTGNIYPVNKGKGKPGTVVRQFPKANTVVIKGSRINIWIKKSMAGLTRTKKSAYPAHRRTKPIKPKLFKKNNKLYMDFPHDIRKLLIYAKNGKLLQQFKKGRRFDVTTSYKMSKGNKIKVVFRPGRNFKYGGPQRGVPEGSPREYESYTLWFDWGSMWLDLFTDSEVIDTGEPNNDIGSATDLGINPGMFSGNVEYYSDRYDWLKFSAGSGGTGTLITVRRVSGDVVLHLAKPNRSNLLYDHNKVWVALKPNVPFYIGVEAGAISSGTTPYRIEFTTKTLNDPHEPNDIFDTAVDITRSVPGRISAGHLMNLMDRTGAVTGVWDYFKFNLREPVNIRVRVNNAGLPPRNYLLFYLYDPFRENIENTEGSSARDSDELTLDMRTYYTEYNPFDPGYWRVGVTESHAHLSPSPYGTGDPPGCYSGSGYSLSIEFLR